MGTYTSRDVRFIPLLSWYLARQRVFIWRLDFPGIP